MSDPSGATEAAHSDNTGGWTCAWSQDAKRWYYCELHSGKSQWQPPEDYKIKIPTEPPPGESSTAPAKPTNVPDGWKVYLDVTQKPPKWYYHNEITKMRTWLLPPTTKIGNDSAHAIMLLRDGIATTDRTSKRDLIDNLAWDSRAFTVSYNRAAAARNHVIQSELLASVTEANELVGRLRKLVIPFSEIVTFSQCAVVLQRTSMVQLVKAPKNLYKHLHRHRADNEARICFSGMTVASAMVHLGKHGEFRAIAGVSDANGVFPGGSYLRGGMTQEDDLCRRIPALWPSLATHSAIQVSQHPHSLVPWDSVSGDFVCNVCGEKRKTKSHTEIVSCETSMRWYCRQCANKTLTPHKRGFDICEQCAQKSDVSQTPGLYPFGPETSTDPNHLDKFSSVVFTEKAKIMRASLEEGYALLPPEEQIGVSVVSAASPPHEVHDIKLEKAWLDTIVSVFVAPLRYNISTNTLVIGSWGCGEGDNDGAERCATLLAKALSKRTQTDKGFHCLTQLYHEIHIAIPNPSVRGIYRRVFNQPEFKLHHTELGINGEKKEHHGKKRAKSRNREVGLVRT